MARSMSWVACIREATRGEILRSSKSCQVRPPLLAGIPASDLFRVVRGDAFARHRSDLNSLSFFFLLCTQTDAPRDRWLFAPLDRDDDGIGGGGLGVCERATRPRPRALSPCGAACRSLVLRFRPAHRSSLLFSPLHCSLSPSHQPVRIICIWVSIIDISIYLQAKPLLLEAGGNRR